MWKIIIIVTLTASIVANFVPTPLELQKAFTSGQNFYASGDFKKAIKQYDFIINTKSKLLNDDSVKVALFNGDLIVSVKTAAYYQKGNALRKLKNNAEAIENFKIVAEQRNDSPWLSALAQYQIADIYYEEGKFEEAIAESKKLINKFPNDERVPKAYYTIGWAFKELKILDSSIFYFKSLVEKFPRSELAPHSMYQIGQNYYDKEDYDTALIWFKSVVEKFRPEKFKKEEFEKIELKAIRERKAFEAATGREGEETPLEIVAKSSLRIADCYKMMNEFDEAVKSYRNVISTYTLLPSLIETAYIKMAEYVLQKRGLDAGIAIYKEAIDRSFENKQLQAKMQYLIAKTFQDSLVYDKAANEYDFYIKAYGEVAFLIDFPVEDATYSKIICLYNAKKYKETIAECDSFLIKFPGSDYIPDMLFFKGISHLAMGEYAFAESSFVKIKTLYKNSPQYTHACVQLGRTYYEWKRYDEALVELNRTLSENPPNLNKDEVYYYILLTYFDTQKYDSLLNVFSRITPGSNFYLPAFIKVSKSFSLQNKFAEGERFIKDVLKTAEALKDSIYFIPEVRFSLADIYIGQEKYKEAIGELTAVINDQKANDILKLQSIYARGSLYYQLGQYKEAISDFQSCILDKKFRENLPQLVTQVNEKLAISYVKIGQIEKGINLVSKLINETSEPVEKIRYTAVLAEAYFEAKDYKNAVRFANDVFQSDISDEIIFSKATYVLANSHRELGEFNKAFNILSKAGEKFPDSKFIQEIFFSTGAVYYDRGEYENAIEIFDRYLKLFQNSENYKNALFFLSYSYFRLGYWDKSVTYFRRFAKEFPKDELTPEAYFNIGESYYNMGKYEEAIREYKNVYRIYPNDELAPVALYSEGWCYYELQKPEQMIESFKLLVKRYPQSEYAPIALFTIGDYYYNSKDYAKAQKAYEEFIAMYPNHEKSEEAKQLIKDLKLINVYAEYQEAMRYFDNKDYRRAIEELTRIWEKYPDSDIVVGCRVNIAAAYEQLGDWRRAAKMYEEIIRDYENSRDDNARAAVLFAREHLEWLRSNFNF
ncbi:tetratricopeptide repeat protein [Candidatus Kryptobacter tengchongensis]|uniref:Tetratricopeptide repeat-containing protein n=1 Tax=Kryptobacter tengchongensis TaxID=1643429 RepID=A0A916LI72_KRYT1|nr:tetratricopeptide repeat protein [Candidatus Kryptobacter tengchongensis]CUS96106.1 Tetratricopeptide repeat-containing protein [Candidatus Kryptobacter tengchongensis]